MKGDTEITNSTDVIDSRDIIERIEYLEDLKERTELEGDPFDEDEDAELTNLKAVTDEAEGYSGDWKYGSQLIRDSYFEDYAQELAEDIGAIPQDLGWPCTCIDWGRAVDELKVDYTCVDFDGVEYWIR
ncbi:hypothetical protein LCGC14_1279740 [marine sediment metagenome]|uniref:Uncharacterized protein n=1 Tax=marine sediment metagenome TaxID=412755 RepID=A0A0F9NC94_9ZZZZ